MDTRTPPLGASGAAGAAGSSAQAGSGNAGSGGNAGTGGNAGSGGDAGDSGDAGSAGASGAGDTDGGSGAADADVVPPLPSCATRRLSGLETATATTTAAGAGSASLSCGSGVSDDVAFYWVAPEAGYYTFDTFGSSFDTVLALVSASCDGTELACNDESASPPASEIIREFDAGEDVVLVVDGKSGSFGDISLSARAVTCPAIDASLQPLPLTSTTLDGTNTHDGACGGAANPEKTFRWTAPSSGLYRFSVSSEVMEPALYVERGPRCGGELLGCNAGGDESPATVVRRLSAGDVVTLIVDGAAGSGAFELNVEDISASDCPGGPALTTAASTPGVLAGGDASVLTGSCAFARQTVLPSGSFDLPEDSFTVTTGSGSVCFLDVATDGPVVVYVLEGLVCGGAEVACEAVDVTESTVLDVELGSIDGGSFEYVVGIEATNPVGGEVSYTLSLFCAAI